MLIRVLFYRIIALQVALLGIDMCTLLYLKWITSKDLLYNTGNSTQYFVITCKGKTEKPPHSSILAWKIPWTEEPGGL